MSKFFEGRLSRSQFWARMLLLFAGGLVLVILLSLAGFGQTVTRSFPTTFDNGTVQSGQATRWILSPMGSLISNLVLLVSVLSINMRRRHDRDDPGFDVVAMAVLTLLLNVTAVLGLDGWLLTGLWLVQGILGLYLLVVLGFLPGTVGPNRHGADPLERRRAEMPPQESDAPG